MFPHFGRRLQRDIKSIVDDRIERNIRTIKTTQAQKPKPIDVNVISHPMQRYAVWFGGSMLGATVCKFSNSVLLICVCRLNSTKFAIQRKIMTKKDQVLHVIHVFLDLLQIKYLGFQFTFTHALSPSFTK